MKNIIIFFLCIASIFSSDDLIGDLTQYEFYQPHLRANVNSAQGMIGNIGFYVETGGPKYGRPYRRVLITLKKVDVSLVFQQADDIWDNICDFYDQGIVQDEKRAWDYKTMPPKKVHLPKPFDPLFKAAYLLDENKVEEAKEDFKKSIVYFIENNLHRYEKDINDMLDERGEPKIKFKKNHPEDYIREVSKKTYLEKKYSLEYKFLRGITSAFIQHARYLNAEILLTATKLQYQNAHASDASREEVYRELYNENMPQLLSEALEEICKVSWEFDESHFMTWLKLYNSHGFNEKINLGGAYPRHSFSNAHLSNWIIISNRVYPGAFQRDLKDEVKAFKINAEMQAFRDSNPREWQAIKKEILLEVIKTEFGKDFDAKSYYDYQAH